jgi:hypothetical protein
MSAIRSPTGQRKVIMVAWCVYVCVCRVCVWVSIFLFAPDFACEYRIFVSLYLSVYAQRGQKPRFVMCYICGREFGVQSLPIHQPQCAEKWQKREALKPRHERKALPKPPQQDSRPLNANSEKELDAFNAQMRKVHEEKVMVKCPYCDRTFNETSFKRHQNSCTADRPAKRLVRKSSASPSTATTSISSKSSSSRDQGRERPKAKATAPASRRAAPLSPSSSSSSSSSFSSSSSSSRTAPRSSSGPVMGCERCGDGGRPGDRFCSKCGGKMREKK